MCKMEYIYNNTPESGKIVRRFFVVGIDSSFESEDTGLCFFFVELVQLNSWTSQDLAYLNSCEVNHVFKGF